MDNKEEKHKSKQEENNSYQSLYDSFNNSKENSNDELDNFFEDNNEVLMENQNNSLNKKDFIENNLGNDSILTKESMSYKSYDELSDFFQKKELCTFSKENEIMKKGKESDIEIDSSNSNKEMHNETKEKQICKTESEKDETNMNKGVNTNTCYAKMKSNFEENERWESDTNPSSVKTIDEKKREKKGISLLSSENKWDIDDKKKVLASPDLLNEKHESKKKLSDEKLSNSHENSNSSITNAHKMEDDINEFEKKETSEYNILNNEEKNELEHTCKISKEVVELQKNANDFWKKKKTEEDPTSPLWYKHKRHFFIFTYSGKPVFTRYGNEENMTSFFGTLLAIISKIESFTFSTLNKEDKLGNKKKNESLINNNKNTIKYIISKNTKIVFLDKGVLFLVCISKVNESNTYILNKLTYIYYQVISLLTKSIEKALRTRPSYDIRNLLNGSDIMICNLISSCSRNPHSLFDGFEPLPLKQIYREKVNNFIVKFEISSVLLSLLIINDKIVSISIAKNYSIYSMDLVILINMITSIKSFKNAESWTPICLPSHNADVFMYAYINYIEKQICCVYVCSYSTSREFYCLSQHTKNMEMMMKKTGCYEEIIRAADNCPLTLPPVEGVDIIHICYYIPNLKQYYSSKLNDDKIKRIFRVYQKCNDILEEAKLPAQIYMESAYEKYYCLKTNLYHLYLVVPFYVIINDECVNEILRAIALCHKDIFINNIPLIIN